MIRGITIKPVFITAASAELVVHVEIDDAEEIELRGQITGPRCASISTIEVAYPLRPSPGSGGMRSLHVLIPEPNLWSASTPFHYDGRVEIWSKGEKRDSQPFTVELRPKANGLTHQEESRSES